MRKLNLNEIHSHQLQILKHVDNFCRKNQIKYWANFGTLLGAVRHKGFIPWDDDVDLTMPFKDYQRFEKLYPHEGRFKLHSYKRDSNYYYPFIKVDDSTTVMKEYTEQHNMSPLENIGVNIDIFPLYDYAKEEPNQNKQKAYKNMLIRQGYINHVYTNKDTRAIHKRLFWKIYFGIRKFKTLADYFKDLDKAMMTFGDSDEYISIWDDDVFKKDWSKQLIDLPFENLKVKAPKNWHETLTALFGDYMTPVKEDPDGHGEAFVLSKEEIREKKKKEQQEKRLREKKLQEKKRQEAAKQKGKKKGKK